MTNHATLAAAAAEEGAEQLLVPCMPGLGAGALPPEVAVVGFARAVHVFDSKQRPKKLTIYGSDFRCGRQIWRLVSMHAAACVPVIFSGSMAADLPDMASLNPLHGDRPLGCTFWHEVQAGDKPSWVATACACLPFGRKPHECGLPGVLLLWLQCPPCPCHAGRTNGL